MNRFASVATFLLVLGSTVGVYADPPESAAPTKVASPFADGKVIQSVGSGTVASRLLQKVSFEAPNDQIKFEVQILSVDSETRDKIYAELGIENVQTRITKVAEPSNDVVGDAQASLSSRHTVTTSSIVSTAVINQEQLDRLYGLAKESGNSKVVARPNIIAGNGQAASMQQQVQRSFLADLQQVEHEGQVAVQSGIQVLSEGTDVTVLGDVDGNALNVQTKIKQSRVADVQQHHVYGIGDGQNTIQMPSHEVREASASAKLLPKQTLLLDPYFQSKQTTQNVTGTPILDNIPYLNKTFKQTELQEVTMNTIVLLKAKKL
ncbi:MAG: hypothetical protein KDB00_15350 [Planctomycetales bacterium]|nr:hypothetical protein [Planctomycetales bacterium]